jgi:hypothetical protein
MRLGFPASPPRAQNLGGWAVAALCRSLSLDNLLTFLTAALLERQVWFGRRMGGRCLWVPGICVVRLRWLDRCEHC